MAQPAGSAENRQRTAARAAAGICARAFGLDGAARPLPGERTLNFRIDAFRDGAEQAPHVLKLHDPADRAAIELESAALEHLARDRAGALVPVPVPAVDGRLIAEVELDGVPRLARMLTWLPGTVWAEAPSFLPGGLAQLGSCVARVDAALATFRHPAANRPLRWNLAQAGGARALLPHVADAERARMAGAVLDAFAERVEPGLAALPAQPIHNDANDRNVVVDGAGAIRGLIDFGDLCVAPRACGLAVACAYAMAGLLGAARDGDPVRAVLPLVRGYHLTAPLLPEELGLLFDLIRTRLAVSICMAGAQLARDPGNAYLGVSQDAVWALLRRLGGESADLAHYRFRDACGYQPVPTARAVCSFLTGTETRPVVGGQPAGDLPHLVLDLSAGLAGRPAGSAEIEAAMAAAGARLGIGRYLEHRDVYTGDAYAADASGQRRTVHLGVDLFAAAGRPVHAPLDGVVHAVADNAAPLDYGPVVILEHRTEGGTPFFTLYGHLSRAGLDGLAPGQRVAAGRPFAAIGAEHENGGWPPHVHLQVLTDLVGMGTDVPGVARLDEVTLWRSLSPDPNLLLGVPEGIAAAPPASTARIAERRSVSMSGALSLSYAEPLHVVRGRGAHLYDETGRAWLDLVNNVAHVGHAHPRVVAAAADQQAVLNTNTRYLHPAVVEYAQRLVSTLPEPLTVCFFTNSGSEANDLALRLAVAHTGGSDVLVLDGAYHGNLSSLIAVSPYKFAGPGGAGRPEHTHVVPLPDVYRGRYGAAAAGYLEEVEARLAEVAAGGRRVAGLLAEAIPGTAGQVVLADGFLAGAYRRVREAGGVCIADEVQTGLGRVGSAFWAFQLHGVVPDLVTLGKPLGNGHPIGAVVTTPQVAGSFVTGMEYFNTFGGNPVSARVGLAVLDVVADERLQARAARLGARLLRGLGDLAERHPLIGDVRGSGLFLGVELVSGRGSREPAGAAAAEVVEAVKRRGILISRDGPDGNVIKLKPPMVLEDGDCDRFLDALDQALAEIRAP